jgi:hypothetical protein
MIRRLVVDASWDLSIDDHTLVWDEETQEYDLAQ